jgi:hypothetical protein
VRGASVVVAVWGDLDALLDGDVRIARWSRPGVFVAPDTSFYIRHPEKLSTKRG